MVLWRNSQVEAGFGALEEEEEEDGEGFGAAEEDEEEQVKHIG